MRPPRHILVLAISMVVAGCTSGSGGDTGVGDTGPTTNLTTFSKSYGGPGVDVAAGVRSTSDGGIVLIGEGGAVDDNDPSGDLWISKLDANGNVEQQTLLGIIPTGGTYSTPVGYSRVRPMPGGGYVAVGTSFENVSTRTGDIAVARFDNSGTLLWTHTYDSGTWERYEYDGGSRARDAGVDIWPADDGGFWVVGESSADLRDVNHIGFDAPNNRGDLFVGARSVIVMRMNSDGEVIRQRRFTEGAFGTYDQSSADQPIIRTTSDGGVMVARRKHFRQTPASGGSSEEQSFTLIQRLYSDASMRWTLRLDAALLPADIREMRYSEGFLFAGNNGSARVARLTIDGELTWSNDYDASSIDSIYDYCPPEPTGVCTVLLGGNTITNGEIRASIRRVAEDGTDQDYALLSDPSILSVVHISRGERNEPLHAIGSSLGHAEGSGTAQILRLRRDTLDVLSAQVLQASIGTDETLYETPDSRVHLFNPGGRGVFTRLSFTGAVEQQFAVNLSGFRIDRGHALVESEPGSYIVAGDSTSFAELAGESRQEAWVARYDARDARIAWQRRIAPGHEGRISAMAPAGAGRVVVGGVFEGVARAVRLDAEGNPAWQSAPLTAPIAPVDQADAVVPTLRDLQATPDGFVTLATTTRARSRDVAVTRLTTDGAVIWQRSFELDGGAIEPVDSDADGERDDGFVLAGPGDYNTFDLISMARLDALGQVVWARAYDLVDFGAPGKAIGTQKIRQTPDGGYVIAITERGVLPDLAHPEDAPLGQSDVLLLKVNAAGEPQWLRIYGARYDEELMDLSVASDGTLLVSGTSNSFGEQDAWLLKLGPDGLISAAGCNAHLGSVEIRLIGVHERAVVTRESTRDGAVEPPPASEATTAGMRGRENTETARQCVGSVSPSSPPPDTAMQRLTVERVGMAGVVSSEPAGISCGTGLDICAADFERGSRITLRADPERFVAWLSECEEGSGSTQLTCVVTLNEDLTVQADFRPPAPAGHFTLSFEIQGPGSVLAGDVNCREDTQPLNCSQEYTDGAGVAIRAFPEQDWVGSGYDALFLGWSGDEECASLGAEKTGFVTVDHDVHCIAQFRGPNIHLLRIFGSVGGEVTDSSPSVPGEGHLHCREVFTGVCQTRYSSTTTVPLLAKPDFGYRFVGWGGDCASFGSAPAINVLVADNTTCTATFERATTPQTLIVYFSHGGPQRVIESDPPGINCFDGTGSDCSESYAPGTEVRLSSDYYGVDWIGCDRVDQPAENAPFDCIVRMDQQPRAVSALFQPN